jgi:hypothetical protein
MKPFLFLVMTSILLSADPASTRAEAPYTDRQGRFSLIVPDRHIALRVDPTTSVAASFGSTILRMAGFIISVRSQPVGTSLMEVVVPEVYSDPPLRGLIRGPDGLARTTLGGCPALRLDESFQRFEQSNFVFVWASYGGNIYSLVFGANTTDFAAFAPMVQTVIDSFTFTGNDAQCGSIEPAFALVP